MKLFFYCVFFLIHAPIYSQEQVGQTKVDGFGTVVFGQSNYSASNILDNNIATLLTVDGKMTVYLFDKEFNQINEPLSRNLNNGGLNHLVGHKVEGNTYSFIYSDNVRNAFAIFSFNFTNKETIKNKIDLSYKGERIVEAFSSYQNRFFVFYASIKGELILREISKDNTSLIELARFPIEDIEVNKEKIQFKRHFLYSKAYYTTFEDNIPVPVEKTLSRYKLYNQNNALILTCENKNLGTSIYSIHLNTLQFSNNFSPYPSGKTDDFDRYNSFISNNVLFQLGVSDKEISLQIKQFDNTPIKEYYASKDDSIKFKNTIIKQKGETMLPFQYNRTFESTSKFLRKMSDGEVGISVQYRDDQYELLIGGLRNNALQGVLTVAGGVGSRNEQTVQITSLLDKNFEHIPEPIEMNTYDKIDEFQDDIRFDTNANLFYNSGHLYYSYIYRKGKELRFLKF